MAPSPSDAPKGYTPYAEHTVDTFFHLERVTQ